MNIRKIEIRIFRWTIVTIVVKDTNTSTARRASDPLNEGSGFSTPPRDVPAPMRRNEFSS